MLSDIHTCSWYYWQNGKVWHLPWQALTVGLNYRSFVLSLYNLPRLAYAIWKFCLFFVTLCYYAICKLCLYFICNCKITRSESWELVGNGGTIVDFLRVKKLFSIISLRYIVRYDQWCKNFMKILVLYFGRTTPKPRQMRISPSVEGCVQRQGKPACCICLMSPKVWPVMGTINLHSPCFPSNQNFTYLASKYTFWKVAKLWSKTGSSFCFHLY